MYDSFKYIHIPLYAGTRITAELWNKQFYTIARVLKNVDETLINFSGDYAVIREDLLEATTNANTATTNANAAIALAEAGAQDAHDAADDARQATQEMSDAADRADAAAINANSKADKANLAANTADSATGLANTATANANTATGLANEAVIRVDNSIDDMNAEIDDALSEMQDDVNSAISLANSATVAANTATTNANNVIADTVVAITATEAATNAAIDATVDTYTAGSYAQTQGDLTKAAIVTANSAADAAIYSANTADSAAEDAHTAKDAANTAAGLANTATTNANANAVFANTATINANAATGSANIATSNANAAATAANTAAGNANDAAASIPGILTLHNEDPDAHEMLRNRVYPCFGDANDIALLGFEMPASSDRYGVLVDFRPSWDNDPDLDTFLMGYPAYEEGTSNTKPTLIAGRVYSAWFDPMEGWTVLKNNGGDVPELPIAANGVLGVVKGLATGDNKVSVNGVDGTMSVPRIAADTVSSALQSRVAVFDADAKLVASSDIAVSNLNALINVDYSIHDALNARILATSKGAANGIAPLDASSKVPTGNLPSFVTPTQLTNHNTSSNAHSYLRSRIEQVNNSSLPNNIYLTSANLPAEDFSQGLILHFRVTHALDTESVAYLNDYPLVDSTGNTPAIVPGPVYSVQFNSMQWKYYIIDISPTNLPKASTSSYGIIRTANLEETVSYNSSALAISPMGLSTLFGAAFGIPDLDEHGQITSEMLPIATQSQAEALTNTTQLMTPFLTSKSIASASKVTKQVEKVYSITPTTSGSDATFTIADSTVTLQEGLNITLSSLYNVGIAGTIYIVLNDSTPVPIVFNQNWAGNHIKSLKRSKIYNFIYAEVETEMGSGMRWICTNYVQDLDFGITSVTSAVDPGSGGYRTIITAPAGSHPYRLTIRPYTNITTGYEMMLRIGDTGQMYRLIWDKSGITDIPILYANTTYDLAFTGSAWIVKDYIHTGSNGNGNWVKYSDGRLECYKTINTNTSTTTALGGVFWGVADLGEYPHAFIAKPQRQIFAMRSGFLCWGGSSGSGTNTSAGNCNIYTVTSTTNVATEITVYAFGRWY